jgi:hypothetical protein
VGIFGGRRTGDARRGGEVSYKLGKHAAMADGGMNPNMFGK